MGSSSVVAARACLGRSIAQIIAPNDATYDSIGLTHPRPQIPDLSGAVKMYLPLFRLLHIDTFISPDLKLHYGSN